MRQKPNSAIEFRVVILLAMLIGWLIGQSNLEVSASYPAHAVEYVCDSPINCGFILANEVNDND